MRIHALPTGQVVLKQAFLHARPGIRRRLDLFLPGLWSDPIPIRAWLIEHGEERILIDMGETAQVKDAPFARHTVTPEDELPLALHAVGLACEDVTTAVVTHLHPDHFHGAVHLTTSVLVNQAEWADAMSFRGRVIQRLTGVPLPGGIDFRPVALDDGPFGAFAAHRRLTTDGRILLVSTPGHTRGHTSVIAVDDNGRHVLLAADATDTLEQLHARRPDAITPDPNVQVQTIDRILTHATDHPTIYLPTHDPDAIARLDMAATL
ncbi:MAG: MBL fold metallo-hydrolase [Actinomycetota bacterium]|nr:MBL fold metallo-hydrolase [Actinomycetota bacterium]